LHWVIITLSVGVALGVVSRRYRGFDRVERPVETSLMVITLILILLVGVRAGGSLGYDRDSLYVVGISLVYCAASIAFSLAAAFLVSRVAGAR